MYDNNDYNSIHYHCNKCKDTSSNYVGEGYTCNGKYCTAGASALTITGKWDSYMQSSPGTVYGPCDYPGCSRDSIYWCQVTQVKCSVCGGNPVVYRGGYSYYEACANHFNSNWSGCKPEYETSGHYAGCGGTTVNCSTQKQTKIEHPCQHERTEHHMICEHNDKGVEHD